MKILIIIMRVFASFLQVCFKNEANNSWQKAEITY